MLFPPKYIMYTVHLIVLYQMFLHTELLDGIQSFEWTFNMPKHHRIHHGKLSNIFSHHLALRDILHVCIYRLQ